MKQTQSFKFGLVACGVALAMASSLFAQAATEGAAKVVRIKGSARYTSGSNIWQPLQVGAVIKPGTVIQTSSDPGSFVELVLGDGAGTSVARPVGYTATSAAGAHSSSSGAAGGNGYASRAEQNTVRMAENTVLGLDKLSAMNTGSDIVTDTQLDLKAGRITGNVKKLSAASKYEIKLPNGVAGVKGTLYDISAEGLVRVVTGTLVVAYVGADGTVTTQVVSGGQQFDARTGQVAPIPAVALQELRASTVATVAARDELTTDFALPPNVLYVSPVQ